jgi:hypothetical protein
MSQGPEACMGKIGMDTVFVGKDSDDEGQWERRRTDRVAEAWAWQGMAG